jgi:surface polysaccharide O-acyltransferase-like enzyme
MNRRHDLDALRVLAFGLLILYHIGMFYVSEWEYHVKSQYLAQWLQYPMLFLNRWRMSLLFLISGAAIGMFASQVSLGRFALSRTLRLLVPLLFGMLAIVPVQAYCQGVSNGLVEPGFGRFMVRYLQFRPWPEGAFDGWESGITWNHLWYLAYLWVYTLVLCALLPAFNSRLGQGLQAQFNGLRGAGLMLIPALPLFIYLAALGTRFPSTHALVDDWFNHATYFTVFLYGFWMARDAGLWEELLRLRQRTLTLALVAFAAYLTWIKFIPHDFPEAMHAPGQLMRTLYAWWMLLAILGCCYALLNRPFRWLPYAKEAVFPWYILHQSFIVSIGFLLTPMQLGPVREPLLVIVGTIGGCLLVHEIVRRIPLLRPLFGLKRELAAFKHSMSAPL